MNSTERDRELVAGFATEQAQLARGDWRALSLSPIHVICQFLKPLDELKKIGFVLPIYN
jgi:hypothetical protein